MLTVIETFEHQGKQAKFEGENSIIFNRYFKVAELDVVFIDVFDKL